MISYKLLKDKTYKLTKVHEDGSLEIKGIAQIPFETNVLINYNIMIAGWITTPVQHIEPLGKGVLVHTLNSTYLIEETEFYGVKSKSKD